MTTIEDEKRGPKTTSLKEMEEELKASDIWEVLSSGGSLTVPVVDYIKDKYKLLSVETTKRLVKELWFLHQDLIKKGFPTEEVKRAINGDKKSTKKQENSVVDPKEEAKNALKKKYEQYQQFQNEDAEVKVKKLLEGLDLPGLIIRSVVKLDVWKKCSEVYKKAGIKITVKDVNREEEDEYDLQMAFVDGDTLNWILIETKHVSSYPVTKMPQQFNHSLFEGKMKKGKHKPGSWGQLGKSYRFLSELFADIPFGKVFVFTVM